jgi:hypothetical protein
MSRKLSDKKNIKKRNDMIENIFCRKDTFGDVEVRFSKKSDKA